GASGIGAAISAGLADVGATVAVADLAPGMSQAIVDRTRESEGSAEFYAMDVTDSTSVKKAVADVLDRYQKIDILVNAAGTISRLPAEALPVSEFARVVDVNLTGVFRVCQAVATSMLA